ncbi:winged helix-turn-helix transcriptional regulator [Streptomyces sp. NPDC058374]|uniref:winged helix-turn-helix transcriptional regulator n=1 Tax=unclassified Streptomyces TaxID=2593676 RepID=UPI0036645210
MREEPRSGCAINAAVEVLGDPWTLIVLRDVIFGGRRHFRDLLTRNEEGIASNILAGRLRKLVAAGLLTRDDAARRGQRATYTLTEAGIQTLPVMVALGAWGLRHRPTTPELAVRARILADSPHLVGDLMDELREMHLGVTPESRSSLAASEQLRQAYEAARSQAP